MHQVLDLLDHRVVSRIIRGKQSTYVCHQCAETMAGFQALFPLYPNKANQIKAAKQEAKQSLKSKPALIKAMAVLN